jgi:uncharacterized oxidoreductase
MKLQDRTLLITGGTSGIGYALVKKLSKINKSIIVIARNPIHLEKIKHEIPNVYTYKCSLEKKIELQKTFSEIIANHPDISVVINNAGIQETPTFLDRDFNFDTIEKEISVNLIAPIRICSLMLNPLLNLKAPAAIVNITSGLGFYPKKNSAVYCATKAGLRNFTQSFRYQLEETPIKVFEAIMPMVDTPMTRGRGKGKISPNSAAEAIIEGIENDDEEIYVGKAKFIPLVSRISPRLMASIMKAG